MSKLPFPFLKEAWKKREPTDAELDQLIKRADRLRPKGQVKGLHGQQIKRVIAYSFVMNTMQGWDTVGIISGDEGRGKSEGIGLNLVDFWLRLQGKTVCEDDLRRIAMNKIEWTKAYLDADKYDVIDFDENDVKGGGAALSKYNRSVRKMFQNVRSEGYFNLLTDPDFFSLDGFFVKRRCHFMIYVYARGGAGFWSQQSLRTLVDLNQYSYRKSVWKKQPDFKFRFVPCNNVFVPAYKEKKLNNNYHVRQELYEEAQAEGTSGADAKAVKIAQIKKQTTLAKIAHINTLRENGMTVREACGIVGTSHETYHKNQQQAAVKKAEAEQASSKSQ